MVQKLGTYLFYVRLVQLFISITVLGENGWLISLIAIERLGLSSRMIAIEVIVRHRVLVVLTQQEFY